MKYIERAVQVKGRDCEVKNRSLIKEIEKKALNMIVRNLRIGEEKNIDIKALREKLLKEL